MLGICAHVSYNLRASAFGKPLHSANIPKLKFSFLTNSIWIDLQPIEWLPHSQYVSSVRVGPHMVGPVDPVVQNSLDVNVLDSDLLPAQVAQVSHPVVLDGGNGVLADTALADLDADALMDPEGKPVGDPEVVALVDNLGSNKYV